MIKWERCEREREKKEDGKYVKVQDGIERRPWARIFVDFFAEALCRARGPGAWNAGAASIACLVRVCISTCTRTRTSRKLASPTRVRVSTHTSALCPMHQYDFVSKITRLIPSYIFTALPSPIYILRFHLQPHQCHWINKLFFDSFLFLIVLICIIQ